MKLPRVIVAVLFCLVTVTIIHAGDQGNSSWTCPNCGQCTEPIKLACSVHEKTKKTRTIYSCKTEDVCLPASTHRGAISSCLDKHCPSIGKWWDHLCCGLIREKRSLQKVVETKEVDGCKCVVHYQCPCCLAQFEPTK
jgi:hypothetical protein